MPKQFYPLLCEKTLFELTVERNAPFCTDYWVVTNKDQALLAETQLGEHEARFILEPVGRNTAPAIALVCHQLDPNTVVLVSASDHLIKKQAAYEAVVQRAKTLAEAGYLVTFGIQPHYAETGYGYIEYAGEEVVSFKEKPDAATAASYIAHGNYLWNSGMFCFTAGTFLAEVEKYCPEVYHTSKAALKNQAQGAEVIQITLEAMQAIPDISIDYGVMEKSDKVRVVPADIGWSDLGSFDALYSEMPQDENGNTLAEMSHFLGAKGNLVFNRSDNRLVLLDVEDLLIVKTQTATLIGRRGHSQQVKKAVDFLKQENAWELNTHEHMVLSYGIQRVVSSTPEYELLELFLHPSESIQTHPGERITIQLISGSLTVNEQALKPGECIHGYKERLHLFNTDQEQPCLLLITHLH
jgi:mannose-1-phosphate guanylyltransferase